jgi:hypothetical protein
METAVTAIQLFIEDDRYSVPTLVFVDIVGPERARQCAREYLRQSAHYRSVEVVVEGLPPFKVRRRIGCQDLALGRCADPQEPQQPSGGIAAV